MKLKILGNGYPHGLAGESIPLGARIITMADSLSAMLQNRYYRLGTSFEKAMEGIVRCSGSQFDPEIGAVVYDHMEQFEAAFTVEARIPVTDDCPVSGRCTPPRLLACETRAG